MSTMKSNTSHGPMMIKGGLLLLLMVLVLPLLPYVFAGNGEEETPAAAGIVPNPGSELWRAVRQRNGAVVGRTQVQGVDTSVLINASGQAWREYRIKKLIPYSAYVFAGVLGALLLYFLIRGRIRIKAGRSGVLVPRYNRFERWVHWIMVAVFLTLALTGLTLLYGRLVLIPLLGPEGFATTAQVGKWMHDITGPVFILSLIVMGFTFLREALFRFKVDMIWFLRAGGYLGGRHPSSGKINAGQKSWYWAVVLGGLVLIVSGLVMYFPNFQQGRPLLQDAHMFHTLAAVFVIAFMFIHIYLASIGMEGSLECMTRGYCDENWAKEQHDLWYEEMKAAGKIGTSPGDK